MKNSIGIYDNSFQLIINSIQKIPEIEKAIIYGSRALGNYKKGSDIDIALVGNNITFEIVSALSAKLNEELPIPYDIDLINYNTISNKDLIEHINQYGKEIFCR